MNIIIFLAFFTFVGCVEFYPYGVAYNDTVGASFHRQIEFHLQQAMPLFKDPAKILFLEFQGSISVNYSNPGKPLRSQYIRLLPYQTVFAATEGVIYYRETFDEKILIRASEDVAKYSNENFTATQAVVITFYGLGFYQSMNTYQVVLVTDTLITYAILMYKRLDEPGAVVGYNDKVCHLELFSSLIYSKSLQFTSNVGEPGKHVKLLTNRNKCSLDVFYSHGKNRKILPKGDKIQANFTLSKPIPFLTKSYATLFISVDGAIGFDEAISVYGIFGNQNPVLAVYSMDFDTTSDGTVYYEETFDEGILERVTKDIQTFEDNNFIAERVVMITYYNVPSRRHLLQKSYFQAILVTNENDTYLMVSYHKLETQANFVGYFHKCNTNYLAMGPDTKRLADSTVTGLTGQYIFPVSPINCTKRDSLFYPHGDEHGDKDIHGAVIEFKETLPFFNSKQLKADLNGELFGEKYSLENSVVPTLAMYQGRMNIPASSTMKYRVTTASSVLSRANEDVRKLSGDSFTATQAAVITYDRMLLEGLEYAFNTFQTVLVANNTAIYAILIYKQLDGVNSKIGYNTPNCNWTLYEYSGGESRKAVSTSNIGEIGKHVIQLEDKCTVDVLYPYGSHHGDHMTKSSETIPFTLTENMFLFGKMRKELFIYSKGFVSFTSNINDTELWLPYPQSVIAVYASHKLNIAMGGTIYFRQTEDPDVLSKASADVQAYSAASSFTAVKALVVTFEDISNTHGNDTNTFQVIIASSNNETYLLFNYVKLESYGGIAGYTYAGCSWSKLGEEARIHLITSLNTVGINGRMVRKVITTSCMPTAFYPYGKYYGDIVRSSSSSKYQTVNLDKEIPFFKEKTNKFYVVINGYITREYTTSTSLNTLRRKNIVIIFLKSCYLGKTGSLFMRETSDPYVLARATEDIKKSKLDVSFEANYAYIATTVDISCSRYKATYQLILATDGNETYAIKNYVNVGFSGYVGHVEPDCKQDTFASASGFTLMTTSNTGVPGQHVTRLTDLLCGATTPSPPTTTTPAVIDTTIQPATDLPTSPTEDTTTTTKTTTTSATTTKTTSKAATLNPVITVKPVTEEATTPAADSEESKQDKAVIGGSIAGAFLAVIIIVAAVILLKRKSGSNGERKVEKNNNDEEPVVFHNKAYEASELEKNGK
ncbi:uncharacterized protein LOC130614088 [Hydractinia symbiolongicarpus]|uniref:uncharacterized protein LOC130614088 n=1 Tax=Hydractinia symbiolongicarpus TaxID=13093 RepID=UPI00254C8BFA|nr:uncharacterized protein LOC130614088 [Hydractinia symbiolongicarpus]